MVEELKARMKKRGDTGQIQRAEQQMEKLESGYDVGVAAGVGTGLAGGGGLMCTA